ncbi:hypothetical protein CKAH01_17871 [Colletotrichum kahawae]|uniref:Uncharacterized protein n=1 Tax=Colletotrichum kahawae TaxID=34407 RepID=A0AAD9YA77_COLKA|nr:hypothetical protein CKAH01_17871 [Colletotrichum kahawae]
MRPVEGEGEGGRLRWEWCSIFGREAGDRDRAFFERALFSLNGLGKAKYLNSVRGRSEGRGRGATSCLFFPLPK